MRAGASKTAADVTRSAQGSITQVGTALPALRLRAQGRQGRTYLSKQKLTPDDQPTNAKGVNIGSEKGVTVGSDLTSQTDIARSWVYVRDDRPFGGLAPPAAVFYYSRDRRGEHPQAHLAKYSGILQADVSIPNMLFWRFFIAGLFMTAISSQFIYNIFQSACSFAIL